MSQNQWSPNGVLGNLVFNYYLHRGLTIPNVQQSLNWIMSEVGELADAQNMKTGDWVRNNPDSKHDQVGEEAADVFMMTIALCNALGINLYEELMKKMKSKGYQPRYDEEELVWVI